MRRWQRLRRDSPVPFSTRILPAQFAELGDEDRRVLVLARQYVPAWIAQVDRVPPAELFETILAESAYAYELRGPRRRQAWENVKKMRSLVRRIQNRGYATMPRIADHLDSLTAGDESNAVLEALDAVNLMTVHASKGLEFPIVFVVNMGKGASGPPRPVRLTVDVDAEGEQQASISVGPFVSEMDEAERQREKHETKRLLYVALTRARDRLYLASALKDGVLVPGRGSLAEVLPQSIKDLFGRAGAVEARWRRSGRVRHLDQLIGCPFRLVDVSEPVASVAQRALRPCLILLPQLCRVDTGTTGPRQACHESSHAAASTPADRGRQVNLAQ